MRRSFETIRNVPIEAQAVEIVERKGTGHPDYICDSVMENISVVLTRTYLKEFGDVLHHNIDKGLLAAGSVEKDFGGGRVLEPMEFIIGDRATFSVGRKTIPVGRLAEECVHSWFRENLRKVRPEKHLKVRVVLKPGSVELAEIFREKGKIKGANDTSAAVGYAPFTMTERAVYECERFLNSPAFKTSFPETGEDVKVMGLRRGAFLDTTVAMPLLAESVSGERDYFRKKNRIVEALREFLKNLPFKKITVNYNTLDRPGKGVKGAYISLLGTSAEDADSGQVGRGNRVNGVISLNRPTGTEAAAGKNPTGHVGKIYNVLSHRMAEEIYKRVAGVAEVYVWLLSEIGAPINEPKEVAIQAVPKKRISPNAVKKGAFSVVEEFLSGIEHFTAELARGEHKIC